jgi:hypothetical protein
MSALFISTCLFSQSDTLIGWYSLNTKLHLNKKWIVYIEGQIRAQQLARNLFYHDIKAGAIFNPSDKVGLHLGVGDFNTYSSDGNFKSPVQTELRVWEQIQFNSNINIIRIDHRYRIEQRFFSSGFRTRLRYRLNAIIPLTKLQAVNNTLNFIAYDEIFLTNVNQIFEKNRWFAGLGYNTNKHFGLQIGWAHDFDLRKDRTTSRRNYFQTALLVDLYSTHSLIRRHHPETTN